MISSFESVAERDIQRIVGGLKKPSLAGLRVLDLGCGSEYGLFQERMRGMPPEFARSCATRGAEVFGIDIGEGYEADKEVYTHITADLIPLVLKRRLSGLPRLNKGFDVIHSRGLTAVPCDPILGRQLRNKKVPLAVFESTLIDEAKVLANEGGLVLVENTLFRKTEGNLERIS